MNKVQRLSYLLFLAIFAVMIVFPAQLAGAATLTTPRDYLKRVDPSLTTGEQHEVFFTTATAVSGGAGNNEVILVFPDADDGLWCATAGADLTVTGITDPTGGSESATVLPGTLVGTCTQGSGGSSYDTITITGVNDLTISTKYGVRIADGSTAKLGTPTAGTTGLITVKTNNGSADVDSADTAVDIVADDEIAVTATVPPSITFTISSNSIGLGTLSTGSVSTDSHTIRTETNATAGYVTLVYDNGNLTDGSNDIDDVGDGAVTAGSEEYGIATSDNGRTISEDDGCDGDPSSALTTTQQDIAGASSGPVDETITVCYAASIASTTIAGAYTQTVYFVTAGLF